MRGEIESFAEHPADVSRMHLCVGYLHQVQGTLHMVELYAPAMVAEELEKPPRPCRTARSPIRPRAVPR